MAGFSVAQISTTNSGLNFFTRSKHAINERDMNQKFRKNPYSVKFSAWYFMLKMIGSPSKKTTSCPIMRLINDLTSVSTWLDLLHPLVSCWAKNQANYEFCHV